MAHQNDQVDAFATMGAGHPASYDFKTLLEDRNWEQLKKSWYIAVMLLPKVPEALLKLNDYALLRKSFQSQGVSAEDTQMFIDFVKQNEGGLTPLINYYRAVAKYRSTDFPVVDVPVLTEIHGNADRETGLRLMEQPQALAPNFELKEIPGGHWLEVADDSSKQVSELLSDFLQQTGGPRRAKPAV